MNEKSGTLRILHTIDSAGIYGAETVLLSLAVEQHRRGHEPILLSIGNPGSGEKPLEAEARRRGLACVPLRMRDGLNLRGAREIVALAAEQRIDVIHSHGYKTNILLGLMSSSARGRPVVATLHGWTAKSPWSKLGLYRFLDQRLLGRLNSVVLVSERLKSARAVQALDPERLTVIPNGIELDATPGAGASNFDELARRIREFAQRVGMIVGAVGRLSAEKNFSALIEAMDLALSRGAQFGLVLLGNGPEFDSLRKNVEDRGLAGKVLMVGYVADARNYIGLFDVLAMPSLTEGLPITLLEAMSKNLPVIATSVGDIPAVLGDLGVLVPPGDADALARAIYQFVAEPEKFRRAASSGQARVREQFSAAAMFERYDKVYRRALAST